MRASRCFPVFNGTGANVLSLQSLLPRWGAVICARPRTSTPTRTARRSGSAASSCCTVPTPDGKLTPDLIDQEAWGWGDEHRAQPLVVSITQTTELGTCYTAEEIRAIAEHVHSKGMKLHMDGARIANAAAHLGVPLRAFTTDAGVDILSFGGTKNGLLFGEAVVVLNPRGRRRAALPAQDEHAAGLQDAVRLGAADRPARGRPVAALGRARQRDGRPAARRRRADRRASKLTQKTRPTASSPSCLPASRTGCGSPFRFYDWNEAAREVRWMCAFDTTEEDVDAFVAAIKRELAAARRARAVPSRPGGEPAGQGPARCIIFHCEPTRPGSGGFPLRPGNPSKSTVPQRAAPR